LTASFILDILQKTIWLLWILITIHQLLGIFSRILEKTNGDVANVLTSFAIGVIFAIQIGKKKSYLPLNHCSKIHIWCATYLQFLTKRHKSSQSKTCKL